MRKTRRADFIPVVVLSRYAPPLLSKDIPPADYNSNPDLQYLVDLAAEDPTKVRYSVVNTGYPSLNLRSTSPVLDLAAASYSQERFRITDAITNYKTIEVEAADEEAPERLSYVYYATPDLWWVIMQYNGLTFPEELTAGLRVRIPEVSAVRSWLAAMRGSSATQNAFSFKGKMVEI